MRHLIQALFGYQRADEHIGNGGLRGVAVLALDFRCRCENMLWFRATDHKAMNIKTASDPISQSSDLPSSRFLTSTVHRSQYLVPWLAAEGPLAYSPSEPPIRDYFFQYTWILPGIFNPTVNLRQHHYFGSYDKDSAGFLFDCWSQARQGHGRDLQLCCQYGSVSDAEVRAPIAAYRHVRRPYEIAGAMLIQHGSYQWIPFKNQPFIERGQALLYRGVGKSPEFRCLQFHPERLSLANREIWRRYLDSQARMLSDSVLSFNTIHDRVVRCETESFRHASRLSDAIAAAAGFDICSPGFATDLWHVAQEGYSLDLGVAQRKCGPHYVVFKTPLDNIRITTFVADESEVKIVDPTRISFVEGHGCAVKFVAATE